MYLSDRILFFDIFIFFSDVFFSVFIYLKEICFFKIYILFIFFSFEKKKFNGILYRFYNEIRNL